MDKPLHVLLIEDNPGDARLVSEMFKEPAGRGFSMEHSGLIGGGLDLLKNGKFDAVLLDMNLPDCTGLDGIEKLAALHPELPVILLTSMDDEALGIQALKKNAADYLPKGRLDAALLTRSLRYAVERKHSEKLLKDERANLQKIFDGVSVGMLLVDKKGAVKRANNAISNWIGKPPQAICGIQPGNALGCVHPVESGAVCGATPHCSGCSLRGALESVLRSGKQVLGVEARMVVTLHGKPVTLWLEVNANPLSVEGEEHVILALNDITFRKQAEDELKDSKKRLDNALEAGGFGAWSMDMSTKQYWCSPRYARIFGCARLPSGGTFDSFLAHILPEDHQNVDGKVAKVMAAGGGWDLEFRIRRPDGDIRWIWMQGKRETDSHTISGLVKDVTEQKLSEEAVKLSEAKFSALYRSMVEGVAIHELVRDKGGKPVDYRIMDVNPAYEALTGIKRNAAVGAKASDLYGTNTPSYLDAYARVAASATPEAFEVYFESMGKNFDISVFALDRSKFVTVFQDITGRKKREVTLKKLNRTLKAYNASAQAMTRADDETAYLNKVCDIIVKECGHAMVWVGFAGDDAAKTVRPVAQAGFEQGYLDTLDLTWADAERGRGPTGTAIRTGKPAVCANMLVAPAFKPWRAEAVKRGYASSVVLPMKEEKRVFGAISIYSREPDAFSPEEVALLSSLTDDLSYGILTLRARRARQKAEHELRETRDYLEKLITYANAPIICWDAGFKIARFNHAFELLTKYAAEEVIGRDLNILFPRSGSGRVLASVGQMLAGKPLKTSELPVRLKDGSLRTLLWNSAHIYAADEKTLVATIAQGQDITGRKEAEEIVKRDKKTLEKLVRDGALELLDAQQDLANAKRLSDIGTLAAIVAHELRNPLAAITMASANIKRKAANPLLDRHFQNIEKKVLESNQIISNLLFYSRLKPPQCETVDLNALLEECVNAAQSLDSGKLRTPISLQLPKGISIEADPVQLKEVFSNLLNNACDAVFSSPGATLSVKAVKSAGKLKISVEDTGAGIDKETMKRIFDPFFTTKAKGTGLGLCVCKQIVELHGGGITISSKPGKGTVVSVTLPSGSEK